MPDAKFDDPRLAQLYDPLESDRSDLDAYADMIAEFGVRSVLDIGCGTGTFACLLAERGLAVTGVDPAAASLDVARAKPYADRVRWLHGDATTLPPLQVDVALMTGNVAQVFTTDDAWTATLRGTAAALVPSGRLVFETRDPARRAWERWNRDQTYITTSVPGVGRVESWTDLVEVDLPLVTFVGTTYVEGESEPIVSYSTLRFRSRPEVEQSLTQSGFEVEEVRDAPDRPGLELVFVARRR